MNKFTRIVCLALLLTALAAFTFHMTATHESAVADVELISNH